MFFCTARVFAFFFLLSSQLCHQLCVATNSPARFFFSKRTLKLSLPLISKKNRMYQRKKTFPTWGLNSQKQQSGFTLSQLDRLFPFQAMNLSDLSFWPHDENYTAGCVWVEICIFVQKPQSPFCTTPSGLNLFLRSLLICCLADAGKMMKPCWRMEANTNLHVLLDSVTKPQNRSRFPAVPASFALLNLDIF